MNATPLAIPFACLKQHAVVLGKTGAGKSSVLRHIAEYLLGRGTKRVVVIDPKGDWWGLNSSADGRDEGFPVLMFGDFKNKRSDVPMDGRAGRTVAEVICSSNQSCVLGFRGWMPADLTRFWIDFASTVFNHNAAELFLIIDEVHNFAAKGKIMDPDAGKCLHWTNRLASEGRGLNIKLLIASQRPQKVHNDTLTSCETLIAMRVIHEADREAIKAWIDGCGDSQQGKTVLAELAQMKRGHAWVWSPEAGVLEKVQFPMFQTFDSFSEHATAAPKKWATVNVEQVREKLARVVEEAKANDPRELRVMNAKLAAELKQAMHRNTALSGELDLANNRIQALEQAEANQVSVFTESDVTHLENVSGKTSHLHDAINNLEAAIRDATKRATQVMTRTAPTSRGAQIMAIREPSFKAPPIPSRPPAASNGSTPSNLPEGERRILTAAAQHPQGITREQATILTSYKRSTRDTYIQRLGARGFIIVDGQTIKATHEGLGELGHDFEPLPTGAALREYWIARLPEGERKILEEVVSNHPHGLSRDAISTLTDYKRSTRDTYIQRLGVRRLVTIHGSAVRASDMLFD